jgi:hypothetical protein
VIVSQESLGATARERERIRQRELDQIQELRKEQRQERPTPKILASLAFQRSLLV